MEFTILNKCIFFVLYVQILKWRFAVCCQFIVIKKVLFILQLLHKICINAKTWKKSGMRHKNLFLNRISMANFQYLIAKSLLISRKLNESRLRIDYKRHIFWNFVKLMAQLFFAWNSIIYKGNISHLQSLDRYIDIVWDNRRWSIFPAEFELYQS